MAAGFWQPASISRLHAILTLPGLGLLLLSGVGLWLMSWSVKNSRWLGVHMGLAVLVTLIAFVVVLPAGAEMMALASTDMVANMEKIVAANRLRTLVGRSMSC